MKVWGGLAAAQNKRSVIALLSAGQKDVMEGFVSMGDIYAIEPPKYWDWVLNMVGLKNGDTKQPFATELQPRSSCIQNLDYTWKDLERDNENRVQLKVVRVLLPDLVSFESLQSLMKMKEDDAFAVIY